MGLFVDLTRCHVQVAFLPWIATSLTLSWMAYCILLTFFRQFTARWIILALLVAIESGRWALIPMCLRRVTWTYLTAFVGGAFAPYLTKYVVLPFLLDPVRGYLSSHPRVEGPPSFAEQMLWCVPLLWGFWTFLYYHLQNARCVQVCQTPLQNRLQQAVSLANIQLFCYLFILLSPLLYAILSVLRVITVFFPFLRDILISLFCGLTSLFFFTVRTDLAIYDQCGR